MVRREWKDLFHNKIMLVVVVAIVLIPIIYAGFFLKSMWDPYGSLSNLPVAIVNHDKPVEYEGKTLQVGDDMVEELRDNDSLAFNFVDANVAENGLRNGTYYMVITIPEDFSKNAATLMDDEPQKMELKYETNPGTNYIASKMSESALTKIKDSVAKEVTRTYTDAVFDAIGDAGDGMEEAADGSKQLQDGIGEAAEGNTTITENLDKLSDSTLTFQDGADTLTEGLKEYTDGVSQVNSGAKQLQDGVGTLAGSAPQMIQGINQLDKGVKQYTKGVATLNDNSDTLNAGVKTLQSGANSLKKGASSLESGTSEYVTGVNTLADGLLGTKKSTGYLEGVEKLAEGASQLSGLESLGDLRDALVTMEDQVVAKDESDTSTLEGGLRAMSTQVNALVGTTSDEGLQTLAAGLKSAKTGMEDAAQGMEDASTGIGNASGYISQASGICSQVASGLQEMPTQLTTAVEGYGTVLTNALTDGMTQIGTANGQMQAGRQYNEAALQQLDALIQKANNGETISPEELSAVETTISTSSQILTDVQQLTPQTYQQQAGAVTEQVNTQLSGSVQQLQDASDGLSQIATGLTAGAQQLSDGAEDMKAGAQAMAEGAKQIPDNLPTAPLQTLAAGLSSAYSGVQALSQGLVQIDQQTTQFPQAVAGVKALNAGFAQLTANNSTLKSGAVQLKKAGKTLTSGTTELSDGTQELASGVKTLKAGVKEYTGGVTELNSNSKSLTDGTTQLADGASALGSGVTQLKSGTQTLYAGTSKLVSNNATLNSGAAQLSDGAGQIHDGSQQLYEGSVELGEGMTKLTDGSEKLTSGLKDGVEQVNTMNTGDSTVEMFAAPVEDEESKMTEVPNNGHAMAPYMMSVALWVGALAFCLLYPLTEYSGKLKSGLAWWASKASVIYAVAILQALVLIGLLHAINDFTPAQMGKTVLFACLTAVTFTSIMYFFNSTFGKVGSFLMLVFMVIQLAGSAGTYPMEISPGFVAKIHAYLPFTYTVDAFRSTICGGESIAKAVIVMVILFLVFTILTMAEFEYKAYAAKKGRRVLYDWMEGHGLA